MMKKNTEKKQNLLKCSNKSIIINVYPYNVKRIVIELMSATPSDKSDLFVFDFWQCLNKNNTNNISYKETKGGVKDSKTMEDYKNTNTIIDTDILLTANVNKNNNETDQEISTTSPFYHLNGKSAADLVIQFELDKYIPVNLDKLLKYYNISLRSTDFKNFEETPEVAQKIGKRGSVLGAVKEENNHIYIYFKDDDSIHRQRFTVAHELAHCCLNAKQLSNFGHIEYRLDLEKPTKGGTEYKANIFAGELLIPTTIIDSIYKSIPNPNVDALAKLFDVSFNVMESRLKHLGYIK